VTLEEKFKSKILENYKSLRAFTTAIDEPYSTIDTMLKRKNGISGAAVTTVIKMCKALNISVEKLSEGVIVDNIDDEILTIKNIYPIEKKKFPLLGEVACGEPALALENFEGYIEGGTDIPADFCLKAKGDSMINARIHEGDVVFIREQPDVEDGEIAAVLIEDEATLKRVYKTKDMITLVAENPEYKPMIYRNEDLDGIRILGKAVAFQSDVK
jgi:repressor LexA